MTPEEVMKMFYCVLRITGPAKIPFSALDAISDYEDLIEVKQDKKNQCYWVQATPKSSNIIVPRRLN